MRRVLVDADAGTDDYLALVYLLHADKKGEIHVEGIICSNGNTELKYVIVNVMRLLEIMDRTDIPVYRGSKNELIGSKDQRPKFHGEDGFGDLQLDHTPDISIVQKKPGALAIYDILALYPNEVSVICLGPLTNLALSFKLFDDLPSIIKDLWIMGGNYTGKGNVSSSAEFNFHTDPEAAYIVLENADCPIHIFPWEPCLTPQIPLEWRFQVLGNSTPELTLLAKAEQVVYQQHNSPHWIPCDAFLAFCFMNPKKHITKSSFHHATIELHGGLTRGQVVLDHMKVNKPNVTIIEEFNTKLFLEAMVDLKK